MKTKVLSFFIFAITLFALGALLVTIFNHVPNKQTIIQFYLALFGSVFGVIYFVSEGLQMFKNKSLPMWKQTIESIRYGLFVAITAVIGLVLKSYGIPTLPVIIVLIIVITGSELLIRKQILHRS